MNTLYPYTAHCHPSRITRSIYLVRWVLFLVGSFAASRLMADSGSVLTLVGAAMLLFLFVGLFRWVLIPRLHDMGMEPAWAWSLLFFVHCVSFLFLLALLLIPSDTFAKRQYVDWTR